MHAEAQCSAAPLPTLGNLVRNQGLRTVFQPIVQLASGDIVGYEGLIRGAPGTPWQSAPELLRLAESRGMLAEFEVACCRCHVSAFTQLRLDGLLFLNLGSEVLLHRRRQLHRVLSWLLDIGLSPNRVVIELTEHRHVQDEPALLEAARELRSAGLRFALDDFGDGRSSLRLWTELAPEIVKVDKHFVQGIDRHPRRFEALRALNQLATALGTALVAEGIETEAELAIVRDLGVPYGQGFLLGRPKSEPLRRAAPAAVTATQSRRLAVYPQTLRISGRHATAGQLVSYAPPVPSSMTNEEVCTLFLSQPELHVLPVVDAGVPVGLINRRAFMDRYTQPFQRELSGRKPCRRFMTAKPVVVSQSEPIDSLTQVMTGGESAQLADGFIVTLDGRYLGIGTAEALMRAVSQLQTEAARYANPLTFLPGNILIDQHIGRLMAGDAPFVACYGDLSQFKPYNDHYGYWRGDEMIKLAARTIADHIDRVLDFVGHIGGDDFVILFQSEDWRRRCEALMAQFNEAARQLYDADALAAGGIAGVDRQGQPAFFPFTTLVVGAVVCREGGFDNHEALATAAAAAKREAKCRESGLFVHEAV